MSCTTTGWAVVRTITTPAGTQLVYDGVMPGIIPGDKAPRSSPPGPAG